MYSLTPTYALDSIGIQIPRPEIKVGHIFKYSDGTYHYGHLGVDNEVTEAMYFSLKIAKGGVFVARGVVPSKDNCIVLLDASVCLLRIKISLFASVK